MIGLNTNLYYKQNQLNKDIVDPGDQLRWLDDLLTQTAMNGSKVKTYCDRRAPGRSARGQATLRSEQGIKICSIYITLDCSDAIHYERIVYGMRRAARALAARCAPVWVVPQRSFSLPLTAIYYYI